jgi:HSP20 family protein
LFIFVFCWILCRGRRRRDPFDDLFGDMFRDMDKLMQEIMSQFSPMFGGLKDMLAEPKMEMYETPDELVIRLEVPGLDPDDIDIKVKGHYLIIRGVKKASEEERKENLLFSETFYGEFQRIIPLPFEANEEDIEATYEKGVLELRIKKPKSLEKKVKIIVKSPEEKDKKKKEDK